MSNVKMSQVLEGGICAVTALLLPMSAALAQAPAERAVVIGGVLTEIVYELGLEDRVAAVDTSSHWPVHALESKPNVGYMRALDAGRILALNPDLILTMNDVGPAEAMAALTASGIPIVAVPEGYSPEAIQQKIDLVAGAFGVPEAGAALAERVHAELAAVAEAVATIGEEHRVLFVMRLGADELVVGGAGTGAHELIVLSGAVNVMGAVDGYTAVPAATVAASAPDTIVVLKNAGPYSVAPEAAAAHPALAATPAVARDAVVLLDGQYLLAFGPRSADAVVDLASELYPELAPTLMPLMTAPVN